MGRLKLKPIKIEKKKGVNIDKVISKGVKQKK